MLHAGIYCWLWWYVCFLLSHMCCAFCELCCMHNASCHRMYTICHLPFFVCHLLDATIFIPCEIWCMLYIVHHMCAHRSIWMSTLFSNICWSSMIIVICSMEGSVCTSFKTECASWHATIATQHRMLHLYQCRMQPAYDAAYVPSIGCCICSSMGCHLCAIIWWCMSAGIECDI